ncbi:hypothetical protein [Oceanisphaera pacifica]|uniref:Adhesin n=1 Tax=Oceanisphaera pacifica TaxID=2818389 RepID=A0ABS3NF64_9GAMM|nr:hypothetical protein [Oceanisphaera pacifica]MBO1519221.1 hypothetical protein [Oceanisphaera pacifica]
MKKFIIAPVATVVMLGLSGYANAEGGVEISKSVDISNSTHYYGGGLMLGKIGFNQLGMAVINNEQESSNNNVVNIRNTNNAKIDDSANKLTGNSGVNVAGGDNNVQSNNTALTAVGENQSSLFGLLSGSSIDAEIFSSQSANKNYTHNEGNHNNATVGNGSLNNSAGNLGANVAAGNSNVQTNNFAVSYSDRANVAVSTVHNSQSATNNNTRNETLMQTDKGLKIGISMSGQVDGTYSGKSIQSNDVYPEIWLGGSQNGNHPDAQEYVGHMDFDGSPLTPNGDNPSSDKAGHFEFKDDGTIDLGKVSLKGSMTTVNTIAGRTNFNNAILSGGSLNNASGNVGVNVAAGTNNLQSNSLALSVGGEF